MPRQKPLLFQVRKSAFAKNGRWWFITGYPNGKRLKIFFKTEKEAKRAANERNAEITATGTRDALPYSLRITALEGSKELDEFGETLADAVAFRLKYLKEAKSSISVAELVGRYLVETERRLKENAIVDREAETIKWAVSKLKARFGEVLISDLTGAEIKAWVAAMPFATKTKNRILQYNRQMFLIAREWDLLKVNPLAEISIFKRRPSLDDEDEIQVLTVEELSALLSAADRRLVPYIAIGAFAGLRDAEIKKLDWSETNLVKRRIEVKKKKAKTVQRRFVDISDNLFAWLEPYARVSGSIIPLSNAPGYIGEPSRKLVYELRKKARIAAGMIAWKPNALRHSFCSYHYAAYEDAGKTAAQAGHTSPATTFANYRELVSREDAKRFWEIRPLNNPGR